MKILISDPVAQEAIDIFKREGFEVEVKTGLSPECFPAAVLPSGKR